MNVYLESKYLQGFSELTEKIRNSRQRAILSVNQELLKIYWEIGNTVIELQKEEGWGSKVIDRLSADLRAEFPDFKGVSIRNLKYMRAFAETYPEFVIVQTPSAQLLNADNQSIVIVQTLVAQIPWSHHIVILQRVKEANKRLFYMQKTKENGWSHSVLSMQIENNLFERQGNAITNFKSTLPEIQSDMATETFKSSYLFDFLTLGEEFKERDIERALIQHIKKFMLELGRGFAYVGNQYNLVVEDDDFFLDLLFYNYHLHCFVTFELKVGDFKPEFAGKLNFYINTIDSKMKGEKDNPTIGILLCKTPNQTMVKFSLQGITTPMGIAEYQLEQALPPQLKGEIPTIEEFEAEIEREYEELKSPADKKFDRIKNLVSTLNAEEIKEKKTEAKCVEMLTKILFPIKNSLNNSLSEVIQMFDECLWSYGVQNNHRNSEDQALKVMTETKMVEILELQLRLTGFKKAGVKAFSIWTTMVIDMQNIYHYTIGKERYPKEPWYENVYHILPDATEIKRLEEKFKDSLYDSITENLERINR